MGSFYWFCVFQKILLLKTTLEIIFFLPLNFFILLFASLFVVPVCLGLLWTIFSITFFGGIWGVPGMIIGVPLFAVIYAIIKTTLEAKLIKKKLPLTTEKYIYVNYIDEVNQNEFVDINFIEEIENKRNKFGFLKSKKRNIEIKQKNKKHESEQNDDSK